MYKENKGAAKQKGAGARKKRGCKNKGGCTHPAHLPLSPVYAPGSIVLKFLDH